MTGDAGEGGGGRRGQRIGRRPRETAREAVRIGHTRPAGRPRDAWTERRAGARTVLGLLAVPWRLLERLDHQRRCRRQHLDGRRAVLDRQGDRHAQALPVGGRLGDVVTDLLGVLRARGQRQRSRSTTRRGGGSALRNGGSGSRPPPLPRSADGHDSTQPEKKKAPSRNVPDPADQSWGPETNHPALHHR